MWHYAKEREKHGPVSQEELVGMLRSGRLAETDLVWREGMPGWRAAAETVELQRDLLAGRMPGMPGGVPGGVVVPATNGMAIASLVLGIVSLVMGTLILTGIPAVFCGHIARRQLRESPLPQGGDGMAIAGLILGYLSIILTAGLVLMLVGMFAVLV